MADFSGFSALKADSSKVVEYKVYSAELKGRTPVLKLAVAAEPNKPYFNAVLKRMGRQSRALRANRFNGEMLAENREEDRELYAEFVIKGWRDVHDSSTGQPVPFSVETCKDLLKALPDWVFDEIREFAGNPANFSEQPETDIAGK